jgi:hypothetical protein
MSTETATAEAPSWLNDRDWLDGKTEIELSSRHLRAYWDADIIDVDDKNKHDTIIGRDDPFEVRFRVQLKGRLWRCICANWCFDVGFTAIGRGADFNVSDILPDPSVPRPPGPRNPRDPCDPVRFGPGRV